MAVKVLNTVNIQPTNRDVSGGPAPDGTPFRVILLGVNDANKSCKVKISPHSRVYASPDVKDTVLTVGLNLEHILLYGQKLWLETFYDKHLTPVFSIVTAGTKWQAKTVNPERNSETTDVYPDELEFITKFDLSNKVADLDDVILRLQAMKTSAIEELTYQKNTGLITEEVFADTVPRAELAYGAVQDSVNEYKANLNTFFDSAPTGLWRKLFRTFTLIAYTTRDMSNTLEGTIVSPRVAPPASAPTVPQASPQVDYRIIQCLHSDLLLAEYCYQSRYPARLPLPYHRPVYTYYDKGKEEDVTNTA